MTFFNLHILTKIESLNKKGTFYLSSIFECIVDREKILQPYLNNQYFKSNFRLLYNGFLKSQYLEIRPVWAKLSYYGYFTELKHTEIVWGGVCFIY